jgi:hypothetical protein
MSLDIKEDVCLLYISFFSKGFYQKQKYLIDKWSYRVFE